MKIKILVAAFILSCTAFFLAELPIDAASQQYPCHECDLRADLCINRVFENELACKNRDVYPDSHCEEEANNDQMLCENFRESCFMNCYECEDDGPQF